MGITQSDSESERESEAGGQRIESGLCLARRAKSASDRITVVMWVELVWRRLQHLCRNVLITVARLRMLEAETRLHTHTQTHTHRA